MNDDDIWSTSPRRPPRPAPEPEQSHRNPPVIIDRPHRGTPEPQPTPRGRRWLGAVALVAVGAILGGTGAAIASDRLGGDAAAPTTTAAPAPETTMASGPETSAVVTTVPAGPAETEAPPEPLAPVTTVPAAPGARDDLAIAAALAPLTMPSDCGLPFGVAESLPNGARDYRGGIHEGIDFICAERGRNAVAAMDGRVVMANSSFVDPANPDRQVILDTAKALGRTPPWTLAMLFGRVVVLDHGNVDGAGHVVTIYAHLEEIDPAIRPGVTVEAGQRLGEIGNTGTETGATGGTRPQSIHLHWEIHVDEEFLARGADGATTDRIYRTLFGR